MKFIDWFAGIGGFRVGMEQAGHQCVGFCEKDKIAYRSYVAMHKCTAIDMGYITSLPSFKQRKLEIEDPKYLYGKWYSGDIKNVDAKEIPRADIWCFGAPCQDFSLCNFTRSGLNGDKSSLVKEIFRLLSEIPEQNKPRWLIYENVEGMLSTNNGFDFFAILNKMVELGYDCEWQMLNSKDFGVPQNRRRIFLIGHLGDWGVTTKILPIYPNAIQTCDERKDRPYIKIKEATKQGYALATVGDMINFSLPNSKTRRGRVGKDLSHTLDTHCELYVVESISTKPTNNFNIITSNDGVLYYVAIRRITPKECFRLQGFSEDIWYNRASVVNSDNALYKLCGNSVTVNVIKAIGSRINDK